MNRGAYVGIAAALFLLLFIPVAALQWIGCFFFLVILASRAYSTILRRGISVERRFNSIRAFKFQPGPVELVITNRSRLPVFHLAVYDQAGNLPGRDQNRTILSIGARKRTTFRYELSAYNRGVYALGPVTLASTDPIGFFPWRRNFALPAEFVVYPSIFPVAVDAQSGIPSGSVRVWNPIYEDVTNYRSVREYVPGDDPRRIDWKVSARTGGLHTTQYLPAISFTVLILLDLNTNHYALRNRYQHTERAIEAAASLIRGVTALGQAYALNAGGRSAIPAGAGAAHAVAGLELLSRVAAVPGERDDGPIESHLAGRYRPSPGTRVYFIGPVLTPERRRLLATSFDPGQTELWYLDEGENRARAGAAGPIRSRWITATGEPIID